MRVMEKGAALGQRGLQDQRFTFHVVEGERCNQPGRIRTIRMDDTGGGGPWLVPNWEVKQGRKVRLISVDVHQDKADLGAFLFTEDVYKDDPNEERREKGWAVWQDYNARLARKEAVGHFPTEWLPQRIQDLQAKGARKKEEVTWSPPKLADDKPKAKGRAA